MWQISNVIKYVWSHIWIVIVHWYIKSIKQMEKEIISDCYVLILCVFCLFVDKILMNDKIPVISVNWDWVLYIEISQK